MQFSGHLLTFRFKSTSAYYKANTRTQIKHKKSTNIQKQNTKQTNKQQCGNNNTSWIVHL